MTESASPQNLPANAGRYCVVLLGLRVSKPSKDDILQQDGLYDEVYAAAISILWDRKAVRLLGRGEARTVEYGYTGGGNRWPGRIQAGSASDFGGIWSGKGNDQVPAEFDPTGNAVPAATPDRFPLKVWEGVLTEGVEGLLIVPSIWDRDQSDLMYQSYRQSWLNDPPMPVVNSTTVSNLLGSSSPGSAMASLQPGLPLVVPVPELMAGKLDRPIGVTVTPAVGPPMVAPYANRFVALTRENLAGLAIGAGITIAVPFVEPESPVTGGLYTLYLRVERMQ